MTGKRKKTLKKIFIFVAFALISVLLELFAFNFRSVSTAGDGEWEELPAPTVEAEFTPGGWGMFVFENIDEDIHYCDVGLTITDKNGAALPVSMTVYVTDEGHAAYYSAGSVTYTRDYSRGEYFPLNTYGKVSSIKVRPTISEEDVTVTFDYARINGAVPFYISIPRMIAVFCLMALIYLIRPRSLFHKNTAWNRRRFLKPVCVVLVLVFNISLIFGLMRINDPYVNTPAKGKWYHHTQYARLARSLADGRTDIDYMRDTKLMLQYMHDIENPYDDSQRNDFFERLNGWLDYKAEETGIPRDRSVIADEDDEVVSPWDTAYYEGKFYVYFGVVPAVLFYMPYMLVTGGDLPNWFAVFVAASAVLCAAYVFMRAFIKRWFPAASYGSYILLSALLGNCTCVMMYSLYPSFYELPILLSVAFVMLGLSLWMSAADIWDAESGTRVRLVECKTARLCFMPSPREGRRVWWRLALGGLFMALVAGCRPQFLLFTAFFFPLFFTPAKADFKSGRPGRPLLRLLCVAVPYIAVAAVLMYYNNVRFGSPFDFGANYNLTTNDMRMRGWNAGRLPDGFFYYLFQMPDFSMRYPYLTAASTRYLYMGQTINETMTGGALIVNVFLWIMFLFRRAKNGLREKRLAAFTVLPLILTLVIVAADTEMAGILQRYHGDFLLLLYISATAVFLQLSENATLGYKTPDGKFIRPDAGRRHALATFLIVALFVTLVFHFLTGMSAGELWRQDPDAYQAIRAVIGIGS